MKLQTKGAMLIVLIISVAVVLLFFYTRSIWSIESSVKSDTQCIPILSKDKDDSLFLIKRNWGITGDGQTIVISKSPKSNSSIDELEDYTYNGLQSFFYKIQGDTLYVYVENLAKKPINMKTKITVTQIELDNRKMMSLYKNFKELGLIKL
jgi:hypothetical protein